MNESFRQQGERIEPLGKNIGLFVSKEYTFSVDALLLAAFSAPCDGERICDLCTGCGILPLYFQKSVRPEVVYGVDIQPEAIFLFTQSVNYNRLEDRVVPLCADLNRSALPAGSFDLVTCNPPYRKEKEAHPAMSEARRIARFEVACTIEDVAREAARLLKRDGRVCLCHLPSRFPDCLEALRLAGLSPRRMRFVQRTSSDAPFLVLIEGRKEPSSDFLVLPGLSLLDENGRDSEEMRKIYSTE